MPNVTPAPPVYAPLGAAPAYLIWIVGIALALLAAGIGVWLIVTTRQPPLVLDLVGLEAEKAQRAILSGLDLKNVIIQCYLQMSRALQTAQGIQREQSMTTREFEQLLEAEGVPAGPVHQLTALFETVRYGHGQPHSGDDQKALACLEAIVQYSRVAREAL